MDLIDLNATIRKTTGNGPARRLRAEGKMPAILYGPETEPIMLAVSVSDFEKVVKTANIGQALPAYDPRAVQGIGVTYATTTMGADHTAGYAVATNILASTPLVGADGPAALVSADGDLRVALLGGPEDRAVNRRVAAGTAIGVPEAIIGMTVVAFGTSLPELSTCIGAARKQSLGLILGNIIGSNTFNILSIVALTAIIKPLQIDPVLMGMEMWATVIVSVGFAAWMLTVGKLTKFMGAIMVGAYVVFIAVQYIAPQIVY